MGSASFAYFWFSGSPPVVGMLALSAILLILMIVWVHRDAERRGMDSDRWVIALVLLGVFLPYIGPMAGLALYLVKRTGKKRVLTGTPLLVKEHV